MCREGTCKGPDILIIGGNTDVVVDVKLADL